MKNKTPVLITVAVVVVVAVVAVVAIVVNNNNGNNGGQSSENNNSQIETNTEPQASSIVGKWKFDDPNLGEAFIYTFNTDGTGNYTASGNFTYTVDGNNLSITYVASGATFETEFEISGDRLNIIDSFGDDTFYVRAKQIDLWGGAVI